VAVIDPHVAMGVLTSAFPARPAAVALADLVADWDDVQLSARADRDTRFQRRATLCSEIPRLVLDVEANPETNLARATDFWLNRAQSPAVSDTVDTLILDLLEWMGPNTRRYAEVLEAWWTSSALAGVGRRHDRGFIARHHAPGRVAPVSVSAAGAEHLRKHRQPSPR
jgi:hypothetical protein